MYRYSRQNRFGSVMRSNRYRPILILALIVIAVVLIVKFVGGNGLDQGNFEDQRNAKLRSEMQHAVSQTNALSRLGATSTSGVLARIRQYVHGIEVVNDLNVGMYGEVGRLYPQSTFETIYSIIDVYDAKLASGQKVNDSLSSLSAAIEEMSTLTNTILDR